MNRLHLLSFALCFGLLQPAAATYAQTAAAAPTELSKAEVDELWRQGSDMALAGNFSKAISAFERVLDVRPDDVKARRALEWARYTRELEDGRTVLANRAFDQYIDAAQKLMSREKWTKAIEQVRMASLNTQDIKRIQALPWLSELVEKVRVRIDEHREKGEWLDALILYDILANIHKDLPEEAVYKAQRKYCQQRAHFETVYTTERDWHKDVKDIEASYAIDVFRRIDRDYYRVADFREMFIAGLENLEVMAESPNMPKVIKSFEDRARRDDFEVRLREEKHRIRDASGFDLNDVIGRFEKLLQINRQTLDISTDLLVYEFVNGALTPLDEFTSVIWPAEMSDFEKHTKGEFTGVGIQITKRDGQPLRVETPLEDTPAYAAGISPGDLIVKVNGESTKDLNLDDTVSRITGPVGTEVTLTVERSGKEEPFDVVLKRQMIKIRSVKGFGRTNDGRDWDYMIDPNEKIGYIRLVQFTPESPAELRDAMRSLHNQGVRGLILDLRFNPGGLLRAAIQICELFLDPGEPIVKTDGRTQSRPAEQARGGRHIDVGPIIVLVNGQSASASEIVAGTLAGNNKAFIIGERSFGKGSVQNLYGINEDDRSNTRRPPAYFKMTTALYYVPDDPKGEGWHCLHHNEGDKEWGVEPNMIVNLIPHEIQKVFDLRRKREIISGINQTAPVDKDAPELTETPTDPTDSGDAAAASQPTDDDIKIVNEAPDSDPQLDVALSVMRMKLISQQPWAITPNIRMAEAGDKSEKAKNSGDRAAANPKG